MGRKIKGRHHRGVKDPLEQAERRQESIADKINLPPSSQGKQEVPRSFKAIKNYMDREKKKELTRNEKVKEDSTINKVPKNTTKKTRPKHSRQPNPGPFKKKKNKIHKLLEKRAAKRDAKIKAKMIEHLEDKAFVTREKIEFGEVVHRPPTITQKIKSKTPMNSFESRPGRKNLLLKSKLEDGKDKVPMSDLHKKFLEKERERVVEMYKVLKQKKRIEAREEGRKLLI